ncbi:hypothetical protein ACFOPQ_10035 [Deinococcus antarcticus]|uniref:Transcriptional regulator n=1 Tax=Deinococcus antarcticus TaxID=1298767 RepID=A0ABV8A9I1_9DEIO
MKQTPLDTPDQLIPKSEILLSDPGILDLFKDHLKVSWLLIFASDARTAAQAARIAQCSISTMRIFVRECIGYGLITELNNSDTKKKKYSLSADRIIYQYQADGGDLEEYLKRYRPLWERLTLSQAQENKRLGTDWVAIIERQGDVNKGVRIMPLSYYNQSIEPIPLVNEWLMLHVPRCHHREITNKIRRLCEEIISLSTDDEDDPRTIIYLAFTRDHF